MKSLSSPAPAGEAAIPQKSTHPAARALLALLAVAAAVALAAGAFQALPQEQVIAGYVTPLDGRSRSQRHNAFLAAAQLNGARIDPGKVFSFNNRVGTFSRDQGYRKAPVSYNGQLISDWGGGVCQVSTTLYNAALLADMNILERHNHQFCPSYVSPGRDAAVAYSEIDLRFRNPWTFPIWIKAHLDDRFIHVELVATQPLPVRPQVVSVVQNLTQPETFNLGRVSSAGRVRNSGKVGYDVCVYRLLGDQRELISQNSYPAMNRVVEYR